MTLVIFLAKLSRFFCKGVRSSLVSANKLAILPISVRLSIATTTPLARPSTAKVPIKARLVLSAKTAPLSKIFICLSCGQDSPVNGASLVLKSITSNNLISAGTRSPAVK